jgi:hypothetical protein
MDPAILHLIVQKTIELMVASTPTAQAIIEEIHSLVAELPVDPPEWPPAGQTWPSYYASYQAYLDFLNDNM